MKQIIEIEDNLDDIADETLDIIADEMVKYIRANGIKESYDINDVWEKLDYNGMIHEIIDSAVPIYTQEIKDIFYLHGGEVEAAFDNAGIGGKNDNGFPNGWKAAAIYCFIEEYCRKNIEQAVKDRVEND